MSSSLIDVCFEGIEKGQWYNQTVNIIKFLYLLAFGQLKNLNKK